MSPWFEMYIKPNGDIHLCCESAQYPLGNVSNVDLQTLYDSEIYKNIRSNMQSNRANTECSKCYAKELTTGTSMRFTNDMTYSILQERYPDNFNTLHPENILKLKIDFSNGCNLKCPMCGVFRSTSWMKDTRHILENFDDVENYNHITDFNPNDVTAHIPKSFIDNNWEFLIKLKQIEVSGGEPFLSQEFIYLLERLVDINWQGSLKIITNMTLIDDKIISLLQKLKVRLNISVDGTGKLYEYVRPGITGSYMTWEDFDELYDRISNVRKNFVYTPQLLNLYDIKPFIEWANTKYDLNDRAAINMPLTYPEIYCISVHPDIEYKKHLANFLEKYPMRHFKNKQTFNAVSTLLQNDYDDSMFIKFKKFTKNLDKLRNTSILDYIPELEKWWD